MTRTTSTRLTVSTEICLYGNYSTGSGYLGRTRDGRMFGTGEPVQNRSFTEAIWQGIEDARRLGMSGLARVFDAGGERFVDVRIDSFYLNYGSIVWTANPLLCSAELDALEGGR